MNLDTNHFLDETELTVISPSSILMMMKVTGGSSFRIEPPVKEDSGAEPGQGINGHDHDYSLWVTMHRQQEQQKKNDSMI